MPKDQEDQETQESKINAEDKQFVDEFKRIATESILRQYENKNRKRLEEPSVPVFMAFNSKWKELTGKPYYQAVTIVPQVYSPLDGKNDTRRSDPRAMNYREPLRFNKIIWQKIMQKIGKKMKAHYQIDGIITETDTKRSIFGRLSVERLYEVFGGKNAGKIIDDAKKEKRGEVKFDIDIDVEAYWRVQFAPQKDQNDTLDVRLKVEGVCLRPLRMIPVIIPGFFLENADHTTKDIFTHEPGKGRKVVGKVQKYPYTVFEKVTQEEYLIDLAAGNKEQREAERKGEESV